MGLRIQNNIASLNTHRNLQIADKGLAKSLERLSSGFRINQASDDAAGLAVSMRFRSQIRSLQQASRNTSEASSMLQVAEGAADQITSILTRMKELATQAASSNTSNTDRSNINSEITSLEDEITRIANSTKYSGQKLIDGSFGSVGISDYGNITSDNGATALDMTGARIAGEYGVTLSSAGNGSISITDGTTTQALTAGAITGLNTETLDFTAFGIKVTVNASFTSNAGGSDTIETSASAASSFQIGYENNGDNKISFSLANMTKSGLTADVTVTTLSGAQTALTTIDTAIDTLADARATIGRNQNRLGFANANLSSIIENLSSAESVIRDTDMAFETVNLTKNQILTQAGTAMLAQANLSPQSVLSLLG